MNNEYENEKNDWIDEIRIRRRTLFSNCILVETEDQQRIEEILFECVSSTKKKRLPLASDDPETRESWYILDGWKGLLEVMETPDKDFISKAVHGMDASSIGGIDTKLKKVEEKLLEGNKVMVIQNLYNPSEMMNSALLSWASDDKIRTADSTILLFLPDRNILSDRVWKRMNIIKPPRSTPEERTDMLINIQAGLLVDDGEGEGIIFDDKLHAIVALTAGMTKDQLEASAVESIIRYNELNGECIAAAKARILANNPVLQVIERPKFGFEGVGGYQEVKELINNYVVLPMERLDLARKYDVTKPRGIIFFGAPGTGKTLFVNSMAKEMNMSVLKLQMEHVLGKYVGESEKSMRQVFDLADAMSPTILFIDEIDRFSKRNMATGDNAGSHVERELFSMLLEKLGDEKREWFFAGATNIVDALDPALIRTGRVDSVVPIPYPDKNARSKIFDIHARLKRKPPLARDVDSDIIAERTRLWTGSDIEQLVVRTTNFVLKEAIQNNDNDRKVTMEDFNQIIDSFNIDTKKNEKLQEKIKQQAIEYTNDKRLINIFDSAPDITYHGRIAKGKEYVRKKRELERKNKK